MAFALAIGSDVPTPAPACPSFARLRRLARTASLLARPEAYAVSAWQLTGSVRPLTPSPVPFRPWRYRISI